MVFEFKVFVKELFSINAILVSKVILCLAPSMHLDFIQKQKVITFVFNNCPRF